MSPTWRGWTRKAGPLMPWNWGKRAARPRAGPAAEVSALARPFDRFFDALFDRFPGRPDRGRWPAPLCEPAELLGTDSPLVDVEETDDELKVTADVPGMDAEDLDVSVGRRSLSIRGTKSDRREQREKNYRRMETFYGTFGRTIALPADVDGDRAEARCRRGQLTVTLPKAESARKATRRIEVK